MNQPPRHRTATLACSRAYLEDFRQTIEFAGLLNISEEEINKACDIILDAVGKYDAQIK